MISIKIKDEDFDFVSQVLDECYIKYEVILPVLSEKKIVDISFYIDNYFPPASSESEEGVSLIDALGISEKIKHHFDVTFTTYEIGRYMSGLGYLSKSARLPYNKYPSKAYLLHVNF